MNESHALRHSFVGILFLESYLELDTAVLSATSLCLVVSYWLVLTEACGAQTS